MRPIFPRSVACGLLAVLWAAWGAPASAGTLQVNPVQVEINSDRRTATVRIRNEEAAPVTIRAYPLGWSQPDGEDRYEESTALIVSPPIFTIAGGGTQMVRIGLRSPAAARRAHRIIIEEVARPDAEGVQVLLRLNLPLFAMMNRGRAADLRWSAWRQRDGQWVLAARNMGSGYVRIETAEAAAATGLSADARINFGVMLPGGSRRWVLGANPAFANQSQFQTIARTTDGGTVEPSQAPR